MEYLYETFNDVSLIGELLRSFLESFGNIETEWSGLDADSSEIKAKTHSLKGVVGNFHIDEIYNMILRFESETDSIAKQNILKSIVLAVKELNEDIDGELKNIK